VAAPCETAKNIENIEPSKTSNYGTTQSAMSILVTQKVDTAKHPVQQHERVVRSVFSLLLRSLKVILPSIVVRERPHHGNTAEPLLSWVLHVACLNPKKIAILT